MKVLVQKLFRQMRNNVVAGILLLIPSVTTIYVFIQLFDLVDSLMPKLAHSVIESIPENWIPGLGLILILFIAYFVGLATKLYLGRIIIDTGNSIIATIPIANKIYNAIQQIIDSISMSKKGMFEKVVLVEFPSENNFSLGFITSESAPEISQSMGKEMISVFIPTAPTPMGGFLIFVAREHVHELSMSTETALKAIISCGLVSTDQIRKTNHLYAIPKQLKNFKWTSIFSKTKSSWMSHDPRD